MSTNFSEGDRVLALADLGHGVRKGATGRIIHVSVFHGLLTVKFDNGAEISAVKLHQVQHAR